MKLYFSLFGNISCKNPDHIGTSQSICFANQLTGFYMTQASTERCFQTDFNGTLKKMVKKRKLLVKSVSYSEPRQKSQTPLFPKKQSMADNGLTNFAKTPSFSPEWALNTSLLIVLSKNFFCPNICN